VVDIEKYLKDKKRLVDNFLKKYFLKKSYPAPILSKAINYSLFPGGKRFRPILAIASAEAVNGKIESVLPVACAIELIHTYSLIHDDLPALDNDDIRRGKPSSHIVFGEDIAILTGDALLTEAFGIMSDTALWKDSSRRAIGIIHEIALAVGSMGMVGGQVLDMVKAKKGLSRQSLEHIYLLKTGIPIKTAVICGAMAVGARPKQISVLSRYGESLGLAFQISDDILDSGTKKEDGYPSIFGREKAEARLKELGERAASLLNRWGEEAEPLRALASYIVTRTN